MDNKSAISLSENDEFHERTKHIDIAYHFTRDCVASNLISVVYIPDKLQLADLLTKGVLAPKLEWFTREVNLVPYQEAMRLLARFSKVITT